MPGGRPLIEHIAETLRSSLTDCLVVTDTPDLYAPLGLTMVGDVFPAGGSLCALWDRRPAGAGRASSAPVPDGDEGGG
jgi:hypothetical protein